MVSSPRQRIVRYRRRLVALQGEASTWTSHWRELADYFAPRRARFTTSDRNRGGKKNNNIVNSRPLKAASVLAAGLMGGLTSPARPWFRLTTPDPSLLEAAGVRGWLHQVEELMRQVFLQSNVYSVLPGAYLGLGTFGQDATLLEDDEASIIRGYSVPIGSYWLAASARGRVDTFYRLYSMTASQLEEKFGRETLSTNALNALSGDENERKDQWFDVLHVIEPNADRQPGRADHRGMAFSSVWFELGPSGGVSGVGAGQPNAGGADKFLRESGYEEFPVLAPRWGRTGEDIYGSDSPGMIALGDAKALQLFEKRKAQLVELAVRPPMKAPTSARNARLTLIPGDTSYVDQIAGGTTYEPAMKADASALQALESSIREHEQRIDAAFFVDLWLMLAESDRREITAEEIRARNEEKMLQLGPVLEGLNDELLGPMIDRAFGIMVRRGLVPPPPRELWGVPLRVEYISILAQAQKLGETVAIQRLAAFVGSLLAANPQDPSVLDNVDVDVMVKKYAQALGVTEEILRTEDAVAQLRAQRAQAQQQAAAAQQAQAAAEGAKTLSEADLEGDNALSRLTRVLGPQASVAAGVPQ